MSGMLGRRYGKALLDLAVEQKQEQKIGKDLADLKETWNGSEQLCEVFENPSVTSEDRAKVIDTIASKMGLSPMVKNFLRLLSDRRRIRHLPDVIDAYEELAERRAGTVRAEVITASPMPEAYYQQLQQALEKVTGKKVALVKREDETLIGGVVTRVGDKVFDGSLRNRLDELKDSLLSQ